LDQHWPDWEGTVHGEARTRPDPLANIRFFEIADRFFVCRERELLTAFLPFNADWCADDLTFDINAPLISIKVGKSTRAKYVQH
jgi:hypothetical protein